MLKKYLALSIVFVALSFLATTPSFAAKEGEACGGATQKACNKGLFCEYPTGTCGIAVLSGTCVKTPEICTLEVKEVCGCNGLTYSNDCHRRAADVSKLRDGPCLKK